ncbi:extracellular solute-binding protein [Paenibacillus thermoaerophilus]|uniref:Extracellular solute-binding protein n=1 Tax=Paenibacillus thermoaerophilus TaxID=1215385 RepID=A0ABW2UYG4_9BACL|nr:extracellular solute-binding protein [Paenibacillus thermoaerophilus]
MKRMTKGLAALAGGLLLMSAAGCSWVGGSDIDRDEEQEAPVMSIAMRQEGDIPPKGNAIERAIENYTGTKLQVQWIPRAAYDDKINLMIAAGEMPKLVRVEYTPTVIGAIKVGMFWEIGPYLQDYPNLAAQDPLYYDNISVNGKRYGVPSFREMARSAVIYRKDWFDALGLSVPDSIEGWYETIKALTLGDPDRNGKNDTYGLMLFKRFSEGPYALTTRLSVSLGGPNKWAVDSEGRFTPEFMSKEYMDVLRLFRRLYAEKLINPDFAVFDQVDAEKEFDAGRVALRIGPAQNGKSQQDRLSNIAPASVVDVEPLRGPQGVRVAGEPGNLGFYLIPKSSVKTEEELKQVLAFLDKLMDPEMATLLLRGIEGVHFERLSDGSTAFLDFTRFQREVKPYRDNLPQLEGYNVPKLKDTLLGEKGLRIVKENDARRVDNPALSLYSPTYAEIGRQLDEQIWDAQTRYIMGKIDDAGWEEEVRKWMESGGRRMIVEYEADYARRFKP